MFRAITTIFRENLFAKEYLYDISFLHIHPSFRPSAWNNSAATGQVFMKFDIRIFFENLSRKLKLQ